MDKQRWKWWPLLAVCLGTGMLLVDVTIVNVALPAMAVDLGTSFSALQWVVDIYALAVAALLLGAGATADRFGHRRVYVAGLAGFALASAACGLAPNVAVLVLARGIQGIAGAAMFATTFALLNSAYRGRDRGAAYGMWGAVAGASAAIGPIVGGLLTEHLSWRWIFFVNLPICAVALTLCAVALHRDRLEGARRVDLAGVASFTVAVGALTFALIRSGAAGWGSVQTLGPAALAIVAGVGFVVIETRVAEPVLDLELLRRRSFVGVLVAALALNFGAFAYLAYLSLWLQTVLDLSPVQAGLVVVPMPIAAFVVAGVAGRRLQGLRPGWLIGGGLVLIGIGALAQAWPRRRLHLAGPAAGAGADRDRGRAGHADPQLDRHECCPARAWAAWRPARSTPRASSALPSASRCWAASSAVARPRCWPTTGSPMPRRRPAQWPAGSRTGCWGSPRSRPGTALDHAIHAATAAGLDAVLLTAGGVTVVAGLVVLRLLLANQPASESEPAAAASASPEGVPVRG